MDFQPLNPFNTLLKMKKISVIIAIIMVASASIFAMPANPNPVTYKLPDGTEITIQLRGNEWINWAETLDGFTILLNADGFWEYAVKDSLGDLQLSGVRARSKPERTTQEKEFLLKHPKQLQFSNSQIETKLELRNARKQFLQNFTPNNYENQRRTPIAGSFRVPVILVEFQDVRFVRTREDFEMLFNQINLTDGGLTGSVRDFFLDNSYGKFDLQADIFGPFRLPGNIADFDMQCVIAGHRGNPNLMATMAVDSAYFRGGANFADYDVNNTGEVQVHIIFAGFGREAGAPVCHSIWSHASTLSETRIFNGIVIQRYSCSPELRGISGTELTNIGVIVHELGHSLFNLPDFYSVGGNAVCLGQWCVMASGGWNDDQRTPARFSAWIRDYLGWSPAITLTEHTEITLPNPITFCPASATAIYRIDTRTANEFFLIENRQRVGWDAFIPSSGMLIYHIDRSSGSLHRWATNRVNSDSYRRLNYIKQAGCGIASDCRENRYTDPYPQPNRTQFDDWTVPNSRSWAGGNTLRPISNIIHNTESREIWFRFMDGLPPHFGIELSQVKMHVFDSVEYGYDKKIPLLVTVTNRGNQTIPELTIEVTGENADAFEISRVSTYNLGIIDFDYFTVVPRLELAVGTYTATVVVSGENDISENFSVSFTVNPKGTYIQSVDKQTGIIISPNPVRDILHIQTEQTITKIELIDLTGRMVQMWFGDSRTIDVSGVPAGIYILHIHTENAIVPIRIVKQ